jgi:hypothetical protein
VHAATEDKTDDTKNSLYKKIGHAFHKFPKLLLYADIINILGENVNTITKYNVAYIDFH